MTSMSSFVDAAQMKRVLDMGNVRRKTQAVSQIDELLCRIV